MTKEQIYDEQINPLMAKIIAICNEHKIALLASFTLDRDEGLLCSTALLQDEYEPSDALLDAADLIYGHRTRRALRLTTRNADGQIVKDEVIL